MENWSDLLDIISFFAVADKPFAQLVLPFAYIEREFATDILLHVHDDSAGDENFRYGSLVSRHRWVIEPLRLWFGAFYVWKGTISIR